MSSIYHHTLPLQHYPPWSIVEMVYASVLWLNTFLPTIGPCPLSAHVPSSQGNPLTTESIVNLSLPAMHRSMNHMIIQWLHAHLVPLHSDQLGMHKGAYFYSLNTDQVLNCACWTPLAMPNKVIAQVHTLACRAHAACGLSMMD